LSPGSRRQQTVVAQVVDVVLEFLELRRQAIDEAPSVRLVVGAAELREQLDLDSMDFLDIVMELRKKYGVEVPEADYPRLATLTSCVDYLEPKLAGK